MEKKIFSKPKSLVEQVRSKLGEAIIKGSLAPGMQLKEIELQDWFGVSRAPIREAMRLLQAEGLIEVDEYRKRCVRKIRSKDLNEIFPLMAMLEGYAARLAAQIISEDTIIEMVDINKKIKSSYELSNYEKCAKLNFEFHNKFINAAENDALKRAMRCTTKGSVWIWLTHIYFNKSDWIKCSVEDHDEVVELCLCDSVVLAAVRRGCYNPEPVPGDGVSG